jgi:hypothetical protein
MAVELAAAILIIVAGTDALVSMEAMLATPAGADRFLAGISAAVGFGLVALGLLIRAGRAWLLALNVVAVAAFLELQSLSIAGIISAILDFAVVGLLLRERWWFQWRPPEPGTVAEAPAPPRGRGGDA